MFKTIVLAILVWSLAACTSKKSQDFSDILIGEFSPLTGKERSTGVATHNGIQMAVDEINEAGGIKGRKIKLISKDTEGLEDKVPKIINELLTQHKVLALIGELASHRSLAAAPLAQSAGIPMISPASTSPKVTAVGEYIFRVCYIDSFQGQVMAKFAVETLKLKKMAILKEYKSEYSQGLAEYFIKTFEKLGGKVIAIENYNSGDIDFKFQLTHIRSKKPDGIFIPGYFTEVAMISRQARKLGMRAHLLGGDGWDSKKLYEIGKDAVNGGYFSNHFTIESDNEQAKIFRKNYLKKYKTLPNGLSALGYDSAQLLFSALKRTEKLTSKSIRDTIASTINHPGVTGSISLNEKRNAVKPVVVLRVDGPTNRYVTTVKP